MSEWEEEEWDADDETDVVHCPSCGEEIYEDAEQCPYCGEYITHSSHPFEGKPIWWVVLGLVGIVTVILALSGFLL